MKTIIIDNYDSFTYNLAHLLRELGAEVSVVRNDCFDLRSLDACQRIVLSPGPGIPREAGLLMDVIRTYAGRKPILGVCLGHQAIAEAFGARLTNLTEVYHGVQSPLVLPADDGTAAGGIPLERDDLFRGVDNGTPVGRYHSWVVSPQGFPACLAVTALSPEGHIMALRHRTYNLRGIQFHPESVLTPAGRQILQNWLAEDPRTGTSENPTG